MTVLERSSRSYDGSGWTPERVTKLCELHAAGYSYSQIAKALGGVTREAVCGKASRIGLRARRASEATTAAQRGFRYKAPSVIAEPSRSAKEPVAKPSRADFGSPPAPISEPERPPLPGRMQRAFAPLPGSNPRPWEDRGPGECKWPIDLPGGVAGSCCLPAGSRYCRAHEKMSKGSG